VFKVRIGPPAKRSADKVVKRTPSPCRELEVRRKKKRTPVLQIHVHFAEPDSRPPRTVNCKCDGVGDKKTS
jgi:hypothetical protein